VDRLLASPAYGSGGAAFMRIWRTLTLRARRAAPLQPAPHLALRDWIVESLNADKGYDRMIVECSRPTKQRRRTAMPCARRVLCRNYFLFNRTTCSTNDRATRAALPGVTMQCHEVPRSQIRSRLRRWITTACARSSSRITSGSTRCPASRTWRKTDSRASSICT